MNEFDQITATTDSLNFEHEKKNFKTVLIIFIIYTYRIHEVQHKNNQINT